MYKKLLAAATVLTLSACSNLQAHSNAWAKFSDPEGEISIDMPGDVKASPNSAGFKDYQARDGEVLYRLAFRKRSKNPDANEEERIFCETFAKSFSTSMDKSDDPLTFYEDGHLTGKNWQGRAYHYHQKSGTDGAMLIAIGAKHNYLLHVMGASSTADNTKRYLSTFQVNDAGK